MKPNRIRLNRKAKGELFTKHVRLAHHLANKFSVAFGLPIDQVGDDAEGLLDEIIAEWTEEGPHGYNPNACNPTSWIYRRLRWGLLTLYTRQQDRAISLESLSTEDTPLELPAKESWTDNLLRTLGEDAKIIVHTILFAPAEIIEDIADNAPIRSRFAVENYLVCKQGWSEDRLERAWEEVQAAL